MVDCVVVVVVVVVVFQPSARRVSIAAIPRSGGSSGFDSVGGTCVCACVCVCVCACVRACVRACACVWRGAHLA